MTDLPPRAVPLVRVAGLAPFVAYLGRAGAPLHRLLARVGLPARVLDRPEALIPTTQAWLFVDEAAETQGIEDLGLIVGRQTRIETLGMFGALIRRAPTLGEAVQAALRAMPAFTSGGRFRVAYQGDRVRLWHEFTDGSGTAATPHARRYWQMLAANIVRLVSEPRWRPEVLHVDTREAAIVFSQSLLDRPLVPPRATGTLAGCDLDSWQASAPAEDFASSILQVMETLSSPDYPRIGLTADSIGMSVRALQRRLGEAGTSYERLIAQARFGTAVHLLTGTDATVLDIALDLGYSDHAHFTRAFRRWTGIPPRTFRQQSRRGRDASEAFAARAPRA